jgi:hypothetical protein
MNALPIRETLTDSIKYWEPRRLVYNIVLGAIVLTYFGLNYPGSKALLFSLNGILFIFILSVLANVAYCAAYLVDVFAQLSGFQAGWRKYRWILLVVGILFAGAITRFFAMGLFSSSPSSNS